MKWRLAVALAGFVLFGIPMLLLNLGALGMQAKFENAINGRSAVPDPIANAGDSVLTAWGNFVEGQEIQALFADRFTRRRAIQFSELVTIEDVLAEGEEHPGREFEELWLLARAPQRAMEQECPVVLDTIGRSCAVSTASVKETSEDGTYKIEAVVGYLPDQDLITREVEGARDLYRSRVRMPKFAVHPDGVAALKRAQYAEIKRLCDGHREEHGNCVISDVSLERGSPLDDGRAEFSVRASLYVVAPKGQGIEGQDL
ncbi:MAG: hypothetical protein AAGO57_01740, partial [Pseudomonadota bacterium]